MSARLFYSAKEPQQRFIQVTILNVHVLTKNIHKQLTADLVLFSIKLHGMGKVSAAQDLSISLKATCIKHSMFVPYLPGPFRIFHC